MLVLVAMPACGHRVTKDDAPPALDDSVATPATASTSRGLGLFVKNCEACHGAKTVPALVGPVLTGERKRRTRVEILDAIKNPEPPMPKLFPGELSAQDVADITAYVETL